MTVAFAKATKEFWTLRGGVRRVQAMRTGSSSGQACSTRQNLSAKRDHLLASRRVGLGQRHRPHCTKRNKEHSDNSKSGCPGRGKGTESRGHQKKQQAPCDKDVLQGIEFEWTIHRFAPCVRGVGNRARWTRKTHGRRICAHKISCAWQTGCEGGIGLRAFGTSIASLRRREANVGSRARRTSKPADLCADGTQDTCAVGKQKGR